MIEQKETVEKAASRGKRQKSDRSLQVCLKGKNVGEHFWETLVRPPGFAENKLDKDSRKREESMNGAICCLKSGDLATQRKVSKLST